MAKYPKYKVDQGDTQEEGAGENIIKKRKGVIDNSGEERLSELLDAMEAVRRGDLTVRVKKVGRGVYRELADNNNKVNSILK